MDQVSLVQVLLSFLLVVGMIGLLALLLKKYGSRLVSNVRPGARLSVSDTVYLDARHRLVLVKRDDTEHLMLIGPQQATLVETFIQREKADA